MNWGLVGIIGISLWVCLFLAALVKNIVCRKSNALPLSLDKYDPNHPEDFDIVRRFSIKITYSVIVISLVVTACLMALTVKTSEALDKSRDYGDSKQPFVSSEHLVDRMGTGFTFAIPTAILWAINGIALSKWKRKDGTSLTTHYIEGD